MLRMREARLLCGCTISAVAGDTDLSYQAIKGAELGVVAPYPKLRRRLSDYYGVPQYQLFADWDEALEKLASVAGGLEETGYKGKKGLPYGEVHQRFREDDDI